MSGNRGGRAPGQRNKRTAELLALAEEGETPCAFALRIFRDETQPILLRMDAARMAAPYIHPRPQPEPRVVSFELPEEMKTAGDMLTAHEAVLRATAAGEIAIEDAKDISAILEGHRRLVETLDLEQRIAALEKNTK